MAHDGRIACLGAYPRAAAGRHDDYNVLEPQGRADTATEQSRGGVAVLFWRLAHERDDHYHSGVDGTFLRFDYEQEQCNANEGWKRKS